MYKDNAKKPLKTMWQKIWYFIWEDDSILSWIVNIVIAFVLIKFVIFPGLGFLLGTSHPVVAVVSGSMEHKLVNGVVCGERPENYENTLEGYWAVCGEFYREYNINLNDFSSYPFKNGFNTGDIIVLVGKKPEQIKLGDVIVFTSPKPDPIIHRVIDINQAEDYYFTTKGDHNPDIVAFIQEASIHEDRVIGKAVFKIPWLGYIKIWFVDLLNLLGLQNSVGRLF